MTPFCDVCRASLMGVGKFWICPTHGDRTGNAVFHARGLLVPSYTVDLRTLLNSDFKPLEPLPAAAQPGGSVRARVARLRGTGIPDTGRVVSTGHPRLSPALAAEATVIEPALYFTHLLGHRFNVLSVFLEMAGLEGGPEALRHMDDVVAEAYWGEFEGLLLPAEVLATIAFAADEPGAEDILAELDSARAFILQQPNGRSDVAIRNWSEIRVRALRLGSSGAITPLQTAVLEAFADILLTEHGAMCDMRRAEARLDGRVTRRSAISGMDAAADLEFERMIPLVIRTESVVDAIPAGETAAIVQFSETRTRYHAVWQRQVRQLTPPPQPAGPRQRVAPDSGAVSAHGSTPFAEAGADAPLPPALAFCRDLTAMARAGSLRLLVGRTQEIELAIETLCRQTKRNPVFVGPAGTGKTAIAEGLAQRIVAGDVPAMLRDVRLLELPVSALLAGKENVGELERDVHAVLEVLRGGEFILFIDEIHTIIGAGSYRNNDNDLAQMLKPALARGDVALIGATTEGEYRHYIESDSALERRLQPIRVHELSVEHTVEVLHVVAAELAHSRRVEVPAELMPRITRLAARHLPNRHLPDKAVDLLEQCVARAHVQGVSRVDWSDVEEVMQRMAGTPLSVEERLALLRKRLERSALLPEGAAEALLDRLSVCMRGLDLNTARPNAVLLTAGAVAESVNQLAAMLAGTLCGSEQRVIRLDLAPLAASRDLSPLLGHAHNGARPGSGGPLQGLAQMPASVLVLENIDLCSWFVRDAISAALAEGAFTDGRGRRIYLSETIVLCTIQSLGFAVRRVGFETAAGADALRVALATELGESFLEQVDVICSHTSRSPAASRLFIEDSVLPDLARRYEELDIRVTWTSNFVDWVVQHAMTARSTAEWVRIVEQEVARLVVPAAAEAMVVRIGADAGTPVLELDV